MTPSDRRLWVDVHTADYLAAVESGDFAAQARLWAVAATDAELEAAFDDIHTALLEHDTDRTVAAIAEAVAKHLPSAEIARPTAGPVTVGMVADELFRHTPDGLSAAAHELNDRLRASADELPAELGLWPLAEWVEARFGAVPAEYLEVFRKTALKVRMRANSDAEHQLAARRKPREAPR